MSPMRRSGFCDGLTCGASRPTRPFVPSVCKPRSQPRRWPSERLAMFMNRSIFVGLVLLSFQCGVHAQTAGLLIGEPAGTVNLVSPEHLPVAMNHYGERR